MAVTKAMAEGQARSGEEKQIMPGADCVAAAVITFTVLSGLQFAPRNGLTIAEAVMVLLLAAVALPTAYSSLPIVHEPDAYAVYGVALAGYSNMLPSSPPLVLRRETTQRDETECVRKAPMLPDGWQAVLADYTRQNRTVWQLVERMSFPRPYVLASARELEAFNRRESWPLFRATYADAEHYFIVSAVGFDAKKRRALVYVVVDSGPENRQGRVHLLEREEHGWKELQLGILCGFIT